MQAKDFHLLLLSWPAAELLALLNEVELFRYESIKSLERQYREQKAMTTNEGELVFLDAALALAKTNIDYIHGRVSRAARACLVFLG